MVRQEVMSVLSHATADELLQVWENLAEQPVVEALRGPETGMIMLRGRMGGGGAPFNLGEATVTRATVRLDSGQVGFSCVLGRDQERARLAAVFDGLWQRSDLREAVEELLVMPVSARLEADRQDVREQTEATRVNFFTMVRGDNE